MWALGAGVKGGYYGQVSPLLNQLDADVSVNLDYRSVLAEVVRRRTSASVAKVFPQFAPESIGFMARHPVRETVPTPTDGSRPLDSHGPDHAGGGCRGA